MVVLSRPQPPFRPWIVNLSSNVRLYPLGLLNPRTSSTITNKRLYKNERVSLLCTLSYLHLPRLRNLGPTFFCKTRKWKRKKHSSSYPLSLQETTRRIPPWMSPLTIPPQLPVPV